MFYKPLAISLIFFLELPFTFARSSSSQAAHVLADLGWSHDVAVLNGDGPADDSSADAGEESDSAALPRAQAPPARAEVTNATCYHGIESTVCRVDVANGELVVYRRGAVSEVALQRALDHAHSLAVAEAADAALRGAVAFPALKVRVQTKLVPMPAGFKHAGLPSEAAELGATAAAAAESAAAAAAEADAVGEDAPGQLVTHYAPDLPTFVVRAVDQDAHVGAAGHAETAEAAEAAECALASSVVVDFGGSLAWLQGHAAVGLGSDDGAPGLRGSRGGLRGGCLAYADLSRGGDAAAAGRGLFAALRWAELVQGATRVLLADVEHVTATLATQRRQQRQLADAKAARAAGEDEDDGSSSSSGSMACLDVPSDNRAEHAASVADRAFRAASGRVVRVAPGKCPPAVLA
jgi:hypothetical protein